MKTLFVGAAGLDTVTLVESYPQQDSKIRAIGHLIEGGGNAANSACAYSTLGADASLLTAIGDDYAAGVILDGLQSRGVNTANVVRKQNSNSGTTYVIVSKDSATRTCIHHAMSHELSPDDIEHLILAGEDLQSYSAVHFDSRHTLASISLAERLPLLNCLVSVDIEKLRPHALELLPYCDVIFCSQHFPAMVCPNELVPSN
jgi:sugar/nucleoside kinase (ribokinase family)